ncbi:pseudoazurin [Halovulum sp. GXIMD14793]
MPKTDGTSHGVMMLNADCNDTNVINVFEPSILRVDIGDSVTFLPSQSGHNSASKRGMVPEGAEPWNGGIDEEVTLTLTVPGIYGYLCLPHYEAGMVGLIIVGNDLSNLAEVRKVRHPGSARRAFRRLLEEVSA